MAKTRLKEIICCRLHAVCNPGQSYITVNLCDLSRVLSIRKTCRISMGLHWSASLQRQSLPVSLCLEIWWYRICFKCQQRWLFTQDILTKDTVTPAQPVSCGFVCCIANMKEDWLDWCYLCPSTLSSLSFKQSNCYLWDHIQSNSSFQRFRLVQSGKCHHYPSTSCSPVPLAWPNVSGGYGNCSRKCFFHVQVHKKTSIRCWASHAAQSDWSFPFLV